MCWGSCNSSPSTSSASSCPPGSTAPCPLQCPNMEIEINNTSTTDDDCVQLKWEHPLKRHIVHCRIRVPSPSAQSTTVVITNPDGRLRFPNDADTTTTVSVPADGSWASFDIAGQTGSNAMNDAVIQAHCQTATGAVLATKNVTVFWFDQAQITLTQGANYQINGGRYTASGGHAASFSSQARIRPAGVNCTAPQVANMRIGIMQESSNYQVTTTWDTPTIAWNVGVPAGTRTMVPAVMRETVTYDPSVAQPVADTDTNCTPLYDRPGQPTTLDPNSLQPPVGCAGGAAATSFDTPSQGVAPSFSAPAVSTTGTNVGNVTWGHLVNTTRAEHFRTFCVIFDTTTSEFGALREAIWTLALDSAGAAASQHANVNADAVATATPSTGVAANNALEARNTAGVAAATTALVHP
jgi:hypothetical protein